VTTLRDDIAMAICMASCGMAAHRSDYMADADAAILAYLSALVEDEGQDAPGTVEQSMKAVLKSWKHAGVTCSPDLEASEIAARAVLRTLLTRAQGESS
jgi:hypothetical protein